MKLLKYFFIMSVVSMSAHVASAAVSKSCQERAIQAARGLSVFDVSFEDLNTSQVDIDEANQNIIWITLESGSSHYPNYFTYKVETRNPDKDNCLVVKVELTDVDGAKP